MQGSIFIKTEFLHSYSFTMSNGIFHDDMGVIHSVSTHEGGCRAKAYAMGKRGWT